ncbi:MAG: hypothetical protein BMS9Abin23_0242 [Thermodesulfobacteriota bacterium]|nr:MAG: hypothetical protein BMS9Abin23_0242 [Thermodesulfobacteriota bacterium]
MVEKKEKKKKVVQEEHEHVCTICGKPSPLTICRACEDKVRAEMIEHKQDIDKAGRTDSGRR